MTPPKVKALAMVKRMREAVGEAQDMDQIDASHMFVMAALQCQYNYGNALCPVVLRKTLSKTTWLFAQALVERSLDDMTYVLAKLQAWEDAGNSLEDLIAKEG